ncbi:MAG: hypothetical protein ACOY9Y_01150 [Bacillota bacterium]
MKWYEIDKPRVVWEYEKIRSKYPSFKLNKYEQKLAWEGEVNVIPAGLQEPPLQIRVICPEGYPVRPPDVFPISPEIPKEMWGHKWHRWEVGKLCFVNPSDWCVGYNIAEVIEKIEMWYFNFLAFKNGLIDKMPDVGWANVEVKGDE